MSLSRLTVPMAVFAAAACSDSTGPITVAIPARDSSQLQTSALEYVFKWESGRYAGSVVVSFTNAGNAPVYVDLCTPERPLLFVTEDASVEPISSLTVPFGACVGVTPAEVASGATRTDTLGFWFDERDSAFNYTTKPLNVGRSTLYRAGYRLYARTSGSGSFAVGADPLPLTASQSNAFRVRFTR
jgi:hypothetical protein